MGDGHGREPERKLHQHEPEQQPDSQHHFRHHQQERKDGLDGPRAAQATAFQTHGGSHSKQGRHDRGRPGHDQAVHQRIVQGAVGRQAPIPFERGADPLSGESGIVEREDDEQRDRRIEKHHQPPAERDHPCGPLQSHAALRPGAAARLAGAAPGEPAAPSPHIPCRAPRLMKSQPPSNTPSIRTIAAAEPKGQSRITKNSC